MEMCRVCLTTEKGMLPLDSTFIINYNILTNLNIALLDGMPQFSCKTCLDTVKYFKEFRDKSIASEATLRDIICSTLKSEEKKDELEFESNSLNVDEETSLKPNVDIKCEIKSELEEENDAILDSYDVTYEEYDGDIKSLVKDEGVTGKRKRKKEKKIVQRVIENTPDDVDDKDWVCGICPKVFDSKTELNNHLDIHKLCRQCELCKEKVNSLSQLLAHRLIHVPAKQLRCHICEKRFKVSSYLEHHYRNVHIDGEGTRLACNMCNGTFISPKQLKGHIIHVHSSDKYFCDICSKGFANKSNLRSHIKHHIGIKSYVCDLCGFSCNYAHGLKDHKIRRHSQKKILCKNCTRAFSSQQDFDKHKCKKKLRICSICGLQLTGSSRLSSHMHSHSDVRRFQCNRCPAKYKTKGALIAHNDRHDGNRTKQCEFCPAKFYTTPVLIKHRRTHTGEKPYVCKVCNKGFTGNHNLKVHMKVHGEYLVVKRNTESDVNNLSNVTK